MTAAFRDLDFQHEYAQLSVTSDEMVGHLLDIAKGLRDNSFAEWAQNFEVMAQAVLTTHRRALSLLTTLCIEQGKVQGPCTLCKGEDENDSPCPRCQNTRLEWVLREETKA